MPCMLLSDTTCKLAPPSVRTLRLSSASFLDVTLSDGDTPLYSVKTEGSLTTLKRHDKPGSSDANSSTKDVGIVYWTYAESPESSPVESPTFASRFIKARAAAFRTKDPADKYAVLVDVDNRRWKMAELLKSPTLGDSRKFHVDGKSFKWRHVNGLWQCFHSSKMIALFEPCITTAPARIRIFSAPLSITRRVLDMIILTCMLLVTNPKEWRNIASKLPGRSEEPGKASPSVRSRPRPLSLRRSPSTAPPRSQSFNGVNTSSAGDGLRRSQSHLGLRLNAPSYNSLSGPTPSPITPPSAMSSASHTTTITPCTTASPASFARTLSSQTPTRPTFEETLTPISSRPASPEDSSIPLIEVRNPQDQLLLRRVCSQHDLSPFVHQTQLDALRSGSAFGSTESLRDIKTIRRAASQNNMLSSSRALEYDSQNVRRGSAGGVNSVRAAFLPPRLADTYPRASQESPLYHGHQRLWERPNAYLPMAGPSTDSDSIPPPPYSPRQSPPKRPRIHIDYSSSRESRNSSTPRVRPERTLVIIS